MSKQRLCRICKQRPPWNYKNCPPGICKACYHRHVWEERPAARKYQQAQAVMDTLHEDLEMGDVLVFGDELILLDDVAGEDELLEEWFTTSEVELSPFHHTQRELHFHITLQKPDTPLHRDLITNLQRLQCTVTATNAQTIEGYLAYNPRSHHDHGATAQVHKLLNRWQRKGHLSWSASRKRA